ncbi:MAG TPA: hypothetical protein VGD06_01315 [Acidobacteriota bacterium]
MRIAVGMPSFAPGARMRRSIDAMVAHLVGAGIEVEGFGERDRCAEGGSPPVFHYLRMAERHRAAPFDTALYPLGRDASPYQGVFSLMSRFPAAVWFLDPIVHHLAIGGIALMEDWAGYRSLLDEAYGDAGGAVAQTVAWNWGTGALYRRYDLVAAVAASQPGVLAAWPALAAQISSRLGGRRVGVVPLATIDDGGFAGESPAGAARRSGVNVGPRVVSSAPAAEPGGGKRGAGRRLDVAVMSVNESYATTAVHAAAAAFEVDPAARVRLCMSKPIYKAEGRGAARRLEIDRRIGWELTASPESLAGIAAESDVLLWLSPELQGGHRQLLIEGLAAGKLTVVPDGALYDDLPAGAVAKLDLGRALGPELTALLRATLAGGGLRDGLLENGRGFAAECPGTAAAAAALAAELERLAAAGALQEMPVSRPVWERVDREIMDAASPGGASLAARQAIASRLHATTRPGRR